MWFFILLPCLFFPSEAGKSTPIRISTADVFRLKCDSLPYRSYFEQTTCFFAIRSDIKYEDGDLSCSKAFPGAKMSTETGRQRVLGEKFLDSAAYHDVTSIGQTRNVLCEIQSEYSCEDGELALPGKCVIRSDDSITWTEALEFCRSRDSSNVAIHNENENLIFTGLLTKNESGWLLPNHERNWTAEEETIDYWRWFFDGATIGNLKCKNNMQNAVLTRKAKKGCSMFGFWKIDESSNKNIALCSKDANCPFCPPSPNQENPGSTTPSSQSATLSTCYPTNDPPRQKDLWNLKYYYNWGRILHAFAATPEGFATIQKNGIGYSASAGSGSLGGTISDEGYSRLSEVCSDPEERKHIVKMWFTKNGKAYFHVFENSTYPKQVYVGYVALKKNGCGSKWPVKRWGCLVSSDKMYAGNLNWNTWYRGRQLNGGVVHFWLWEMNESVRDKQRNGCGPRSTTTVPLTNLSPRSAWLQHLKFYFNTTRILHAFAASPEGIKKMMSNGIGYSTKHSRSIGRTLKEDKVGDLKKICQRANNLQKLYFNRTGDAYVHSFGIGDIFCGWVAVNLNDCGAKIGQRKWTCSESEDIMYSPKTSEPHKYHKCYKGREQDGGKDHFYLW